MLDTSDNLDEAEREIGYPVEQLLTPLTRFRPQRPDQRFAIDNGAFAGFRPEAFESLLERERPRRSLCRFVSVPDVVCSARRTLEVFYIWAPRLTGWPLALVVQNGQEHQPIPWRRLAAVFIGGDTAWKCGPHAEQIIRAAKALGVWVHVGRVNTPDRLKHFEEMGADSIDGTGISRFSHMRLAINQAKSQATLFGAEPE